MNKYPTGHLFFLFISLIRSSPSLHCLSMHCPISLLVFTLVAVAASGAVDGSTIKGSSDLQIIAASKAVRSGAKRMTNAQRLAMNLPPLKPKRLYSGLSGVGVLRL